MKLLVPLDGSAPSRHALDHALWLASMASGATVMLLNVQNAETLGLSDIAARSGREREQAIQRSRQVLRASVRRCRERGVRCEECAEYGPVAETIERVAREAGADQIIMGTRGLGHVRGLLLGSVATQVVRLARVPVTLVKKASKKVGATPDRRGE